MPPRAWRLRIADILDSIAAIKRYTAGMDQGQFVGDERTVDAVMHRIGVIGEAVSGVPDDVKSRHPAIPWRDIRSMRNVLTHAYFGVDLGRVWDVVQGDLDLLADQLRQLLAAEGEANR